jgi:ABC transporter substrate binding protein
VKRRDLFMLLGGAVAAWPLAARAQDRRIARVGLMSPGLQISGPGHQILIAELRKLGFTEGQNLVVDARDIGESVPGAFANANELVAAKADVLVVSGTEIALQAAAAVRPPVPIVVLANNYDPIERGYVASLPHPGGNITGLFYRQPELAVKQLELLVEAFPGKKRVGVLYDQSSADEFNAAERAQNHCRSRCFLSSSKTRRMTSRPRFESWC